VKMIERQRVQQAAVDEAKMMMMSFICSCRNKNQPPNLYTPRVLPTIRGCLEGLALMV
jgi:hypothetical protein